MSADARPASVQDVLEPWEVKAKHETIFCVFLLALAFFFRSDPSIVYPELLYVFVGFLGFNLLYNMFLKQRVKASPLAFSPVFVNGLLITCAVHYSGGASSYLWVMYLLPIFTACLLYDGWGIVLSLLYVLALNASVYGSGIWDLDAGEGLQFFSKNALLVLSASITARLAAAERSAKTLALVQRRRYEESLERLWGGASPSSPERQVSLMALGIHDVNTALGIILGSTQLIVMQEGEGPRREKEDLSRIESAVRLGKVILQNLFLLGEAREEWPREKSSLHALLEEGLEQSRGEIRSKGLQVDMDFSAARDEAAVNPRLLRQAFTNLLFAAVAATPAGGKIRLATRLEAGGGRKWLEAVLEDGGPRMDGEGIRRFFDPRWAALGRGKGVGLGLYLGREILLRHGVEVEVRPIERVGNRIVLRFPLEETENNPVRLAGLAEAIS